MHLDGLSIECLGIVRRKEMDKTSVPSLFEIMNRTKTECGERLLKANLLQPLKHETTLLCRSTKYCMRYVRWSFRYEAVQELVENDDLRSDIGNALNVIPKDVDRICSLFSHRNNGSAEGIQIPNACDVKRQSERKRGKEWAACRPISQTIDGILLMKAVFESLESLRDVLHSAKSPSIFALNTVVIQIGSFEEYLRNEPDGNLRQNLGNRSIRFGRTSSSTTICRFEADRTMLCDQIRLRWLFGCRTNEFL